MPHQVEFIAGKLKENKTLMNYLILAIKAQKKLL